MNSVNTLREQAEKAVERLKVDNLNKSKENDDLKRTKERL
jgi:hypothetical protein